MDDIDKLIESKHGQELISNFEEIEQVSLTPWETRELVKANFKQFMEGYYYV